MAIPLFVVVALQDDDQKHDDDVSHARLSFSLFVLCLCFGFICFSVCVCVCTYMCVCVIVTEWEHAYFIMAAHFALTLPHWVFCLFFSLKNKYLNY